MAGIGFELKKLFKATGVLSMLRAYGYTGMITAGPMILGFIFLLSVQVIAGKFGMSKNETELLVSIITYSLLASMIYSSIFSMVMTRFVADLLYEHKEGEVIPSLEGILCFLLPTGLLLWGTFLVFSGVTFTQGFLSLMLFGELLIVWTEMNYLSAIKDYRGILISYVISIALAVLAASLLGRFYGGSVTLMLLSVVLGYGFMMTIDMGLLYGFFPNSQKNHFDFLPWFDEYSDLMVIGLMSNIGLFSHLVIAWFGGIGHQIKGLFYAAPEHDISALFAFLTILITTINFVASVEVNLYPKYRRYYDLFNGHGSIFEIEQAEKEMLTVLDHELIYTARRQFYGTALILSVGLVILERLPLGFDALMEGYFRILCVGYGAYAVANVLTLVLMYFTAYEDAKKANIVFAVTTTVLSLVSLLFESKYYGFAFAFGSIVYLVYGINRLMTYTKRLPYHILSSQPLLAVHKKGLGTKLYLWMLSMEKKRRSL
ncbi:exopolysaccharide Pel transporter PelG [Butyrivibrio sp. VCB2006]|uniref:exopolysaccharide Pel transporter PelG n=1 Tax=Butyrivibrio sp. VCB2006 TaxID=1280679 RepID=UPI0004107D08|nr:exopolysaccharide Pel transporter PelG [Butyrivibrio sp. VCB2006]